MAAELIEQRFWIPGLVPSKKNGKMLTNGRTITNPETQRRLEEITNELRRLTRWAKLPITNKLPLTDCYVSIEMHVSRRNSDLDNALTSILDCLQDANIIKNDSTNHTKEIHAKCKLVAKGEEGVEIYVQGVPYIETAKKTRSRR